MYGRKYRNLSCTQFVIGKIKPIKMTNKETQVKKYPGKPASLPSCTSHEDRQYQVLM